MPLQVHMYRVFRVFGLREFNSIRSELQRYRFFFMLV